MPSPTELAAPLAAAAAAVHDSESDSDNECPEEEPEFVLHVVDRPLLPPGHQFMEPMILQLLQHHLPHLLQPQHEPDDCNFFLVKIIHGVLVLILAVVTLIMVCQWNLPQEYYEGAGIFMLVCPILIAVLALSWLLMDKMERDKEQG